MTLYAQTEFLMFASMVTNKKCLLILSVCTLLDSDLLLVSYIWPYLYKNRVGASQNFSLKASHLLCLTRAEIEKQKLLFNMLLAQILEVLTNFQQLA